MTNRATRMGGADAAWLVLDRPRNRMIVNTVLWTAGPVDADALVQRLDDDLIPSIGRLRTRVVEPVFAFGPWNGPRWEPVPTTAAQHVIRTALPGSGAEAALWDHLGEVAARPLPAGRPPWQVHVIDGYGPGSAVLLRTHHALADGTAIMRLVDLLSDGGGPPLPEPGAAPPRVFDPGTWTDPGALAKLGTGLGVVPPPPLPALTGRKSVRWTGAASLAALRRTAAAHGATVNDLGLAAIAQALPPVGPDLRVVVPVHLRTPAEPVTTDLGNRFGLVFVTLPVGEPDTGTRVRRIHAEMTRIKETREAQMVHDAFVVLGHTPGPSARGWADAFSRQARAVVTNIRGPAAPLRLGGSPVTGVVLLVPSTGPLGIGLSICSYAGQVRLGLIADDAVVPDPEALLGALDGAWRELAGEASGERGAGVGGEDIEDLNDTVP